ncbi:hypothetical protein J40TS1_10470 [Paenibacillus montaniterrae]|uniref:Signal transduction histidine kinase n=1 Tax=Paenibacillus montaniterrae TaxID=429341 RepID=A0A919YL09_9BACL|nr:hypothetical protein [Paenibacillus montaniterrae]GIP15405.1 hypothetical protein J40TS1_10470 [Paenibacillus montaniterrae]
MDGSISVIFIILAFSLGLILILKKDTIPAPLKKWLAISSLVMIAFAFFIIIYSLFKLGT